MKTAEEIVFLVINPDVRREIKIKLVENYGIQREREGIEKLHKETLGYCPREIEEVIERITSQLDDLLDKTMEAGIVRLED